MNSGRAEKERPTCPCCRIFLDGSNLFLPRDGDQAENASSSPSTEVEGTSTLTSKRTSTSSNINDATEDDSFTVMPPLEAWKRLRSSRLVDTHCHAHLERESSALYFVHDDDINNSSTNPRTTNETLVNDSTKCTAVYETMISLSCAVEQADWVACLNYAAQSPYHVAALGIHPWYLDGLDKHHHQQDNWLQRLEQHLQRHAHILVGEIGLCKQARFLRTYEHGKAAALDLQRHVFVQQLALAVQYQRPVSIHCVNQQEVLLQVLQQTYENCGKRLPPAIALHSFTGTAHHVKQLLKWEASLLEQSEEKSDGHPQLSPPLLYFGFSHAINYAMCSSTKSRNQGVQAILAVPRHRVLAESDVHCTSDVSAGTAGAIAYLASALGESLESVANLTARNGLAFLGSVLNSGTRTAVKDICGRDP